MLNYKRYLFGFILLCSQVIATQQDEEKAVKEFPPIKVIVETRVSGQVDDLAFRSITKGDAIAVEAISSRCIFKEGLPGDVLGWANNLIVRQQTVGNPYSGVLLSIKDQPEGFLCTGFMPAIGLGDGYKLEEHAAIVETFFNFGAICLKEGPEQEPKFTKGKYELVDNCGLGMLLPILPIGLGEKTIQDALKIGVSVFQSLKDKGMRLPKENTIPGYVIGLFDPTDPLLPHLEAVGFKIDDNKGFFQFYDKERVLAYIKLQ